MDHEDTMGENKGKERHFGFYWRDFSCVMLGIALVRNRVCVIRVHCKT